MSALSTIPLEDLVRRLAAMPRADQDHVLARIGPEAMGALEPMLGRLDKQSYSGALSDLIQTAVGDPNPDGVAPGVAEFLRDLRAPEIPATGRPDPRPSAVGPGLLRQARQMFSGRSL